MTGRDRLACLGMTDLFRDQSESALRAMAPHFDEVTAGPGESIALEGRLCHQFVVVAGGRLRSCSRGVETVLGLGDSLGWVAMRERGANDSTVVALTEARLLVMSHAQFRAAEPPPARRRTGFWALPTSRRSLPHRQHLQARVKAKQPDANPAC